MEFHSIDIPEMEKQRYNAIKRTGQYIELNILIGVENEEEKDNTTVKSPVVSMHMHDCGPVEVASLYATTKAVIENLEKQYPVECLMSNLTMKIEGIGSANIPLSDDEEE